LPQALSQSFGFFKPGIGQQHSKFLAAETARQIVRTEVVLKHVSYGLERGISGRAAEGIVDPLEVVQVQQDQRKLAAVALDAGNRIGAEKS
jgi:hypothetical protein